MKCQRCGREVEILKCRYCGGLFCRDCISLANHNCPGISNLLKRRRRNKIILTCVLVVIALFLILNFSILIPKPTPIDLRERLWRYELSYALEVALSSSELSKIDELAKKLKRRDVKESAWNVLEWEDENIEYDGAKANVSPPVVYYTRNPYYNVITDVKVVSDVENYYQTPYETVKIGKGICSDYAILTAGLLLAMNFSPVYIFDIYFENEKVGHVATSIKVDGHYFILDQHLPIWDLGRYYDSWVKKSKYIKNVTVYEVSRGERLAKVRKVCVLTANDLKKDRYKVSSTDLRKIESDLLDLFEERLHLKRDANIQDGKIWSIYYEKSFYHPEFHNMFINHVFENVASKVNESSKFWIETELEEKFIIIRIILSK